MQKNVKKLRKNLEKVKCSSYLCIGFRKEPLDSCFLHAGAQHISSISQASFQSDQEASFILPDNIRRSINPRPNGLYIDQAWAIKKHLNYGTLQTH